MLKGYKGNCARARGLAWELSNDEFDRLTAQDCFYCGSPPSTTKVVGSSRFTYNGIDRVDNSLGYSLENVVTCCQICNRAKSNLPYDEFMAWVGHLTAHQWFSPEQLPSRLLRGAA